MDIFLLACDEGPGSASLLVFHVPRHTLGLFSGQARNMA